MTDVYTDTMGRLSMHDVPGRTDGSMFLSEPYGSSTTFMASVPGGPTPVPQSKLISNERITTTLILLPWKNGEHLKWHHEAEMVFNARTASSEDLTVNAFKWHIFNDALEEGYHQNIKRMNRSLEGLGLDVTARLHDREPSGRESRSVVAGYSSYTGTPEVTHKSANQLLADPDFYTPSDAQFWLRDYHSIEPAGVIASQEPRISRNTAVEELRWVQQNSLDATEEDRRDVAVELAAAEQQSARRAAFADVFTRRPDLLHYTTLGGILNTVNWTGVVISGQMAGTDHMNRRGNMDPNTNASIAVGVQNTFAVFNYWGEDVVVGATLYGILKRRYQPNTETWGAFALIPWYSNARERPSYADTMYVDRSGAIQEGEVIFFGSVAEPTKDAVATKAKRYEAIGLNLSGGTIHNATAQTTVLTLDKLRVNLRQ